VYLGFENVGSPGLWDWPPVYFRHFENADALGLWGNFSGPTGYLPGYLEC
jgi:hypothetical protein